MSVPLTVYWRTLVKIWRTLRLTFANLGVFLWWLVIETDRPWQFKGEVRIALRPGSAKYVLPHAWTIVLSFSLPPGHRQLPARGIYYHKPPLMRGLMRIYASVLLFPPLHNACLHRRLMGASYIYDFLREPASARAVHILCTVPCAPRRAHYKRYRIYCITNRKNSARTTGHYTCIVINVPDVCGIVAVRVWGYPPVVS